jgi:mRNA interferase MazF
MRFGGSGSEQSGWRPGLVFQNNLGNRYSPNIIALPLTSCLKKTNQPTHVVLPAVETGLPKDSMVLCENPERMSKDRLGKFVTSLSKPFMERIAVAHLLASSAISFLDPELLLQTWRQACSLNAT